MGKLKILLILIVVLIITSAINQSMVKNDQDKKPQDKSLEKLAKPTPTASPTPAPENANGQTSNSESQTPNNQSSQDTIEYVYPGSTVIKTEGSTIFLQSSADPTTITNWYVDQIEKAGFSAKSTVRTNTNGNILNKISASSSGQKIEIEIKRAPNSSITEIKVNIASN